MSKHVKHHDSKNHVAIKESASQKGDNGLVKLVLIAALALILGLFLGAVLTMGYFTIAGPIEQNNNQTKGEVDVNELTLNVEDWVNTNLINDASVFAEVKDVNYLGNNLYELTYEIYQEGQLVGAGYFYSIGSELIIGQRFDLTKSLEIPEVEPQEPVEVQELSEEDVVALGSFMSCLADKNVVVYGANWCGYTNSLVNNLGGFSVIEPIYVECTVEEELCSQQNIVSFPTIKMNGEAVNIARTIDGFAGLTGCVAPSVNQATTTTAGSC
jgi:hypothetical protein